MLGKSTTLGRCALDVCDNVAVKGKKGGRIHCSCCSTAARAHTC